MFVIFYYNRIRRGEVFLYYGCFFFDFLGGGEGGRREGEGIGYFLGVIIFFWFYFSIGLFVYLE